MNGRQTLDPAAIGALIQLVEQEQLSDAEARARALLSGSPGSGMLWKILGVILLRQNKDALPVLRKAAELLPHDAGAHGNLGAALYDRGEWAPALASLRQSLAIEPRCADVLVDAADSSRALGRPLEAVPLYQRALQVVPRLTRAHNNLGNTYLELGQPADAVRCYRAALQSEPRDAQIHCNLGNALRQLGLLSEALASTRQALLLEPNLSVAHNNLGLILAAGGQRNEAVTSYRHALLLDPSSVDTLNNLGNLLRELGERGDAVALYVRAIELDAKRAESRCNLGNVLFELRRLEEAVTSYHHALALQPQLLSAHVGLGTALKMLGHAADAEVSCQAALRLDAHHPDALHLLGELRADRGRFSEAQQLFARAIAGDPNSAPAYASIAAHRKMTEADRDFVHSLEELLAASLPLAQEIRLRYALGKCLDDLGEYPRAFAAYRQANELSKKGASPFEPGPLQQRIDRLIRAFDASTIDQWSAHGNDSQLPVFIIGMPRSGTSLAEQILASHPAAFGAGEIVFWDAAFAAHDTADFAEKILPVMARNYLDRLQALAGGALRVTDKMPANFMYAGLIHAAFPRARIIHMRRHAIDTCLSIYFQNFYNMGPFANDLENLALYYHEYRRITAHWRAVLPASSLLEIAYEDLLDDQEVWTRRMLDFIGLPWDPRCLNFHQADRVVLTASKWQVRQKLHTASVGRWKHYEQFLGPLRSLVDSRVPADP